jgi:4-methoxybenzoate monooxygenase (O-demethylating)
MSITKSRSPYAIYESEPPPGVPVVDIDPFSIEFFTDPYPFHGALRDAGPFVWLSKYGIGAVARHEHVREALMDWQTFSSARGVGMEDFVRHGRFRLPSLILEADPPLHSRSRGVLSRVLSPPVLKRLRDHFEADATALVDAVVKMKHFDGISDLAETFPLRVFPDAMGIRHQDRPKLLAHADLLFNSFGPRNELFQLAERKLGNLDWIEELGRRENLTPGSLGMMIHEAADRGETSQEEAPVLVRALLQAGLDTTINALGASLYCLARFPSEWDKLRANPMLAKAAFEEAIRYESPVQTFFRTSTRRASLGGTPVNEGDKVLMFLAAANRDPRHWQDADRYNITRRTLGHVGFGAGIHACVGQLLARMEGEVVLSELAKRVKTLRVAGQVERRFNNTVRGLAHLPLEIVPV